MLVIVTRGVVVVPPGAFVGVPGVGGDRTCCGAKTDYQRIFLMKRKVTDPVEDMCNSVGHDNISLQNGNIIDKELASSLVNRHIDSEQGLVLPPVLEGSRIPHISNNTVVHQSVGELLGSEGFNIDPGSLECCISRSKTGELGCRIHRHR